jgi:DeoR family transcriptional regulator of aga operon
VEQAKRKIAVTDHSKLGVVTKWLICRTDEIDMLITDRGASDEMIAPFLERGLKVLRV